MKEYSPKQIKQLQANPYTLKVTKNKLYLTAKFKEDFWIRYQAGSAPKKIVGHQMLPKCKQISQVVWMKLKVVCMKQLAV